MSLFGLVGKVLKKKFGKPEEKTVHERYMEARLAAEEIALSHGVELRDAYKMAYAPLMSSFGPADADRFLDLKEDMDDLYVQLSQIEKRHWSLDRDDKDLFSDL